MKTNKKATPITAGIMDPEVRTSGGYGVRAAVQSPEALLRRLVMTCLLWEDLAYMDGEDVANQIATLVPLVAPSIVAEIAIEARTVQKLRHVPLWIAVQMARVPTHRRMLGYLLPKIIRRVDEMAEFISLYWKDKKVPLAKQIKLGLAVAFHSFNEYQFAKYRGEKDAIKLRDVIQLVHPKPASDEQSALFKRILDNTLTTPSTWEVALSGGANKRETFERMIKEKSLGALAFLRNIRNMEQAGVDPDLINKGLTQLNAQWLLPLNYFAAYQNSMDHKRQIETWMISNLTAMPKLPGRTLFIVDVSGSMDSKISDKSEYTRLDVACVMAAILATLCDNLHVYATGGNSACIIKQVPAVTGFAIRQEFEVARRTTGCNGIFTRQTIEQIKLAYNYEPDRIIVFSDSQDMDRDQTRLPAPFGKYNYIVDVSNHAHGVNYKGVWTAEISGWSDHFIDYIMELEGLRITQTEQDE